MNEENNWPINQLQPYFTAFLFLRSLSSYHNEVILDKSVQNPVWGQSFSSYEYGIFPLMNQLYKENKNPCPFRWIQN